MYRTVWEDEYLEREITECKTGWVTKCHEPEGFSEQICKETPVNECSTEYEKVPVRVSRMVAEKKCVSSLN